MKPKIVKPNGTIQRADTALSKPIAIALSRKVLAGETLYPPERYLLLNVGEDKPIYLARGTLNAWISRDIVIPEIGLTLREYLDKARADYRVKRAEELRDSIVETAEHELNRTLRIRTNLPVRNMFGQEVTRKDGTLVRRENAGLLRVKMDNVQYALERLKPEKYGKVERGEHKHLVFNLADLRREKQAREQAKINEEKK